MKVVIDSAHISAKDFTTLDPTLSATICPLRWHYWFGHTSLQMLAIPKPYHLGKHHHNSFSSQSFCPSNLVRSDIWGPVRIKSISRLHYFVIFINDFSRMMWLFVIKNRFELPKIFTTFYSEERQRNNNMKKARYRS